MFHNFFSKMTLIFSLLMFLSFDIGLSCSMYKITFNGKTMVGNNEDSWRLTSQIWFERATKDKFGVAYVGYSDKSGADGAINEFGLVYDAFTLPHRPNLKDQSAKKQGLSYKNFKLVMQKCKTVDEAYKFLIEYDLTFLNGSILFNGGMVLFVDKTGKYMSVEADTIIIGNEKKYILANFSVANTTDLSTIKIERYCKGVDFLKNKTENQMEENPSFSTQLSDTMSVCRKRVGDGTLYTTIYDLNEGIIYLYFFHNYKKVVKFHLKDELAKENHTFAIPALFPVNEEYQKFANFKTPQNNKIIFYFMLFSGGLFLFSSIYFLINFLRNSSKNVQNSTPNSSNSNFKSTKLLLFFVNLVLCYYCYVLMTNQAIFYFPAPYQDYKFSLLNVAAYIPFLMLLLIFPLIRNNIKIAKEQFWGGFAQKLFVVNNVFFILLLCLFAYWGLFNVFN